MNNFYSVKDIPDVAVAVKEAIRLKAGRTELIGSGKTILLLFFNPSLRTRLSTEVAARKLGMNVIVMDMSQSWKWELEEGTVMQFDSAEHIKDAAKVISSFVDLVAIRSFPGLKDRATDYNDVLIRQFMKYSEVPVINMESGILHPLQSLADMITIEEYKKTATPKIVLSWAPHPKVLPQAVSNSFLEWAKAANYQITITHPPGYELADQFTSGHQVEHDQHKAFEGADFVYVKNWSTVEPYAHLLSQDPAWRIDIPKMELTNQAKLMHCMPIRRNVVANNEVLDSAYSILYQQAGNRMHAATYVIHKLLKNG